MKTESGNKLDEKLSEALSRAVLSETESSFADRDAFQNWLNEGARCQNLNRRRKIRRAGLAVAAVFLCVILLTGSLLLSDTLPPSLQALLSPEEGVAVPGFNSNVESGNGNVVIGGDGNGNAGTWTATFTSYDEIPEKYREQIIWFEEMPEGYELESAMLTRNYNSTELFSHYKMKNGIELIVKQTFFEETEVSVLNDCDAEFKVENQTVYIKKVTESTMYILLKENSEVIIIDYSDLTNKKIEAMIASVKIGWSTR